MELADKEPIDRSKRYRRVDDEESHPQRRAHRAERKHESRLLERGRSLFYPLSIAVQFHFRRFTPRFRAVLLPRFDTIEQNLQRRKFRFSSEGINFRARNVHALNYHFSFSFSFQRRDYVNSMMYMKGWGWNNSWNFFFSPPFGCHFEY